MSSSTDKLFSSLRRKFTLLVCVMLAAVMAASFAVACITRAQSDSANVRAALEDAARLPFLEGGEIQKPELSDSASSEPPEPPSGQFESGRGGKWQDQNQGRIEEGQPGGVLMLGGDGPRKSNSLVPIVVYDLIEGSWQVMPGSSAADISDDVSEQALAAVEKRSDGQGELPEMGLVYCKSSTAEGACRVAFTDASYTDGWKQLALMLTLAGLVALVVLAAIAWLASKRILAPVAEAWASQRRFVADASHDLKTPLTVILANMSILKQNPTHTVAQESQWVENTITEAETMQDLVNEMLELSQAEEGKQDRFSPVDFSDVVEEQTLLLDAMALDAGCAFDVEVEENLTVSGDETRLAKMVKTLLENAFKYAGAQGAVSVSLSKDDGKAHLSISNTGVTIPAEDIEHIFDRFWRADKARTSGEGGFGLGLAIVKADVEAHGGTISCSSAEGHGTVFEVELPLIS